MVLILCRNLNPLKIFISNNKLYSYSCVHHGNSKNNNVEYIFITVVGQVMTVNDEIKKICLV